MSSANLVCRGVGVHAQSLLLEGKKSGLNSHVKSPCLGHWMDLGHKVILVGWTRLRCGGGLTPGRCLEAV